MDDAREALPALAELGVGCLYLSPILQAAPGSTHGYDTTDPGRIDADRGGRAAFDRLLAAARARGVGLVLDIVPNHMCVTCAANRWWWSVLTLGRSSPRAGWFDIDFDAPHARGRVILPVLGEPLDDAIANGLLSLRCENGEIVLAYHEHRWPLRPATAAGAIRSLDAAAGAPLTDLASRLQEIEAVGDSEPGEPGPEAGLADVRAELAERLDRDPALRSALDTGLRQLAEPSAMTGIVDAQHYRPMHWRDASGLVNYRRFFNIDELAAVRAERPEVFESVSSLILELAAQPGVAGLRVDHPDGLRDPKAYFDRLAAGAPDAWIVAEKILEADEALPDDWAVAGITGYDFLNDVTRLMIAPEAEGAFSRLYASFTGRTETFQAVALRSKREAAERLLAADLDRVSRLVARALPEPPEPGRVAGAVAALAAALPVYRTYLSDDRPTPTADERRLWQDALERASEQAEATERALLASVAGVLRDPGADPAAREGAIRFQQFSAPTTAKGLEDTAFYRSMRFPALNEVGGDPGLWSMSPDAFHKRVLERSRRWPHAMLAASTHDTKRSEDVRARLCVLSEMPDRWAAQLDGWHDATRQHGGDDVEADDLYLLLHTLVGAWPIDADRVRAYMRKAVREAKQRTSWRDPNAAYEGAIDRLIDRLFADQGFMGSVAEFAASVRTPGRIKSLAQTALRLACPGVPDVYQGTELWDLSLVDPDNRRPVDADRRSRLLRALRERTPADLWPSLDDADDPGLSKLWLTRNLLRLRREHPAVFGGQARYLPLEIDGPDRDRCIAFARGSDHASNPSFAAVLPLRTLGGPPQASVRLPPPAGGGAWMNLATGSPVTPGSARVDDLFASAPLALLAGKECSP
jgi:(1->4)-alpha-D-glucan 1-alpha-D-glucosylmutase